MIGTRIKEYRKRQGVTIASFAQNIGVSQGTLSDIENGKTKPSADTISSIVRETDIDPRWFLTGEDKTPQQGPAVMVTDEDPEVAELLEGARRVLKSGNPIAFDALERNIRYFDHAVATEKRLEAVEGKLDELMKVLAERKAKKAANG